MKHPFKGLLLTSTCQARNDIALHTKPKRDAFFLAHNDYFLPLLPESNRIVKLQRLKDAENAEHESVAVPYVELTAQPAGVMATMKPYQLQGLSFLVYMYENGVNAILGDEMGLGKTLQTLSLLQHLKNNNRATGGEPRPTLVVCPLSVLSSWMNEAKKWVPELNVVRFHGPKMERERLKADCRAAGRAANIDVIVTTYEAFVAEQGWFKRAFVWRYCILDEGHKIKNSKSDVAQALQGMSSEYRLLLTGTPLQNNLTEMWALLHWLYDEVFTIDTADKFKCAFDLTKGKVSTDFMDDARRLLELVMLRRMKNSPGVNLGLPPKEDVLLYVPLSPMQRFWYTRLLTKTDNLLLEELFKGAKAKEINALKSEAEEDKQLKVLTAAAETLADPNNDAWNESKEILQKAIQSEAADSSKTEWQRLMNLILQLRKVCSHPYILPHSAPEPYYLGDHIKTASGKFIVLDKLIDELVVNQGKKVLIFAGLNKTLDLCEDLLTLKGANTVSNASFRYTRFDGSTSRARRNLDIRLFNAESDVKVMLISTRAGGLGINLTAATNVVFMDEDWNPQVSVQAEARAHRIGQTQKVTIYRLCTQGTVEEQMLGRIRKKLYLSTKITESMRNIHTAGASNKRKRTSDQATAEDDTPHLDTTSLKSLIRRGAQTLAAPVVDVTEMLEWDWETTLERCKDKTADPGLVDTAGDADEVSWLSSMERVECAVFEGKKHQKEALKEAAVELDISRADRRVGKNTTVMIDGFAINKESLACADWEAVPTMAGKDPRLAEPKRAKRAKIEHQEFCQTCGDNGKPELVSCSGCPRSYHVSCLDTAFQGKAKGMMFYCPQHECVDCQAKTSDAGGMIYRCRWCENGFCEDCLDWETTRLIGDSLPEYQMLGFGAMANAYYIECAPCLKRWEMDPKLGEAVGADRLDIETAYQDFLAGGASVLDETETPETISEVGTPAEFSFDHPFSKKTKKY